jgi:hypothetical protein
MLGGAELLEREKSAAGVHQQHGLACVIWVPGWV